MLLDMQQKVFKNLSMFRYFNSSIHKLLLFFENRDPYYGSTVIDGGHLRAYNRKIITKVKNLSGH